MLALTIREKNGEERQLIFEKEEVTIGRATGSDIVLPRSNISKRHARLVDKHDKVVIVDLRSTNGTYVNGRRITAPELLTYEDKVYIGDFVIRLSRPAEQHASQRMTAPYTASATPEGPRTNRGPTAAIDAPMGHEEEEIDDPLMAPPPEEPRRAAPARAAVAHEPEEEEDRTRAVMAMPDEEDEPPKKPAPRAAPPVVPATPKKEAAPAPGTSTSKTPAGAAKQKAPEPVKAEPAKPAPVPPPSSRARVQEEPPPPSAPAKKAAPPPPPPPPPEPETMSDDVQADPWAEWNLAIQSVVERIEREHETVSYDQAEAVAGDAVAQAIDAGEIAAETEREALTTDVVAELVGLGPIADTLNDPSVVAIYMNGPKSVYIDRGAGIHEPNGRLFATEGSYRRVIANLTGLVENEEVTGSEEITLGTGAVVRIVGAGLGAGPLVVWRRAAQEVPLLPDLVAEGMLDQAQSHALSQAIHDGRSILLCGAAGPGRSALAAAICVELGLDRRVVAVGDRTEVALQHGNAARVTARSLFAGTNVAGLEPDMVVFERLDAGTIGEWVETCLTVGRPVLALSPEPFAERAMKRLGLLLELAQLPASPGRGAVIVGEAVDLVVSLKVQADGTTRVDKIQECESSRDGFTLKVSSKR
jgi:pilus assembly protein CpaF